MRHVFGGSPADFAMERVGNSLLLRPNSGGEVWTALTGGTQLTDLTDLTGNAITQVTADNDGAVAFYGPDGVTSLYIDFGYGRRYAMAALDTGTVLAAFMAQGGAADGWASLDGLGRLPVAQLPSQLGAVQATSLTTNSTVNSAFLKTTSNTEHAATIYQAATGTSPGSVALNVISDKPGDSTMWLTGHESARGTLKIAHLNPGSTATADASAAALSIDLQWNGMGGTAAQGIFLTATTGPTTGNLITLRNSSPSTREDFVVKADGKVGIRIPVGNTPLGALQIGQIDDTTVGLFIKANSGSGLQSVLVQDSAGNNRFEIAANGSSVHRASSFFTSSVQIGATSLAIGGLNGAGIGITNSTAEPTSSPSGGGVLYAFGGALKWRGSSGTVTTIANA